MTDKQYEYFTLGLSKDPRVAVIDQFRGVSSPWELNEGVRMGDKFPPDVEATLDPERGSLLTDFLHNTDKVVPISEKARALFEAEGLGEELVEYLLFVLKNQKGRVVRKPQYCLANPLLKIDCLDRERSEFGTLKDGVRVTTIDYLYLLKDKIPEDAKFFRLGEQPNYIIYRSDLVERIREQGLSGLNLTAMGEEIW